MINEVDPYLWKGEPIQYKRTGGGTGLVIGKMHYRFNKFGDLERLEPLNRAVLELALKHAGVDNPELVLVSKGKNLKAMMRQLKTQNKGVKQ